jgi:hypothetical protein
MNRRLPAFDVLVDMARNDPQGLETLRRALTGAVIAAARSEAARRRLLGLQFRIDMERRRAQTPLAATIRISEMMCHSLAELHRCLVAPETIAAIPDGRRGPATVIPMFDPGSGEPPEAP